MFEVTQNNISLIFYFATNLTSPFHLAKSLSYYYILNSLRSLKNTRSYVDTILHQHFASF